MIRRLVLAWRVLCGAPVPSTDAPAGSCARCRELEQERNYWRSREERVAEALIMREAGVAGVARPFQTSTQNPVAAAMAAMGKESYDPRLKQPAPHQQGATRGR